MVFLRRFVLIFSLLSSVSKIKAKTFLSTGEFSFLNSQELESLLPLIGLNNIDFQSFKEKSSSNKVLNKYKQNTQLAYEFGVFGVPSFSVNENLFWGDDRLNDIVHLKKELNLV